jgi:hypothetical protein
MARIPQGANEMKHVYAATAGFALAALVFFCCLIAWQTVVEQGSPIVFEQGEAVGFPEGDDTLVIYKRKITALQHAHYDLERSVSCEYEGSEYVQDLPPLIRELERGESKEVRRVISFPIRLPIGTRCELRTSVLWAPLFSMINHSATLPPIGFVVDSRDAL